MVILSNEVENVLNRIFLVGVAYQGNIPTLYGKVRTALLNLDKTVLNVYATAVNNAPFAWKRDNYLVLVIGKFMFSYEKKPLKDGGVGVVVYEVAENGQVVMEQQRIRSIIKETINQYLRRNLMKS